jgi:hypothetical protein
LKAKVTTHRPGSCRGNRVTGCTLLKPGELSGHERIGKMNIIEQYNSAKQVLYDHVGFVEDWVIFAIEDRTEMFWAENGSEVKYAETLDRFNSDGDYYVDEIYTQRFYKKWVYRGQEFTMIFVDTHTDGNKFFAVYSNSKEIKKATGE